MSRWTVPGVGAMSESASRKTFRLSDKLSVEISIGPAGLTVEWDPDIPPDLTPSELTEYRRARAEMVTVLANHIPGLGVEERRNG